jgi:hypothetical protein
MIPQSEWHAALTAVLHGVPLSHPKHPALACVLVEFADVSELRLIGSDGERITVVCLTVEHGQPVNGTFQIPVIEARGMLDIFPPDAEARVTLCFMGNTLMVTNQLAVAGCEHAVCSTKYPEYRKVMHYKRCPPDPRWFNRQFMIDALACMDGLADTVGLHINGLVGPGYIDAVLRDGLECITSIRVGLASVPGPVGVES